MPANYRDKLCEQLSNLKQSSISVAEYMQKFDEIKTRSQVAKKPCQTLAGFKTDLRPDIQREMLRLPVYNVEHAFQVALDMEEYLRDPITRKNGCQTEEAAFKKYFELKASTNLDDSKGKWVMPNNSSGREAKCFKCGEVGHMSFQCPKKTSLLIEIKKGQHNEMKVIRRMHLIMELLLWMTWRRMKWILLFYL